MLKDPYRNIDRPARRVLCALLLASSFAAVAAGKHPAARAARAIVIQSCVQGGAIQVSPTDSSVLLESDDQQALLAEMMERYPLLERSGDVPVRIMMWRQLGGTWLYVALARHPEKPGDFCFTATFAAAVFELTPVLSRKYFFAAAAAA